VPLSKLTVKASPVQPYTCLFPGSRSPWSTGGRSRRFCFIRRGRDVYPQSLAHSLVDRASQLCIAFQSCFRVLAALAQRLPLEAKPRPAFVNDSVLYCQIQEVPFFRDTLPVHYVEFGLLERRSHFVLDYLYLGPVPHDGVAVLDRAYSANLEANRGVKLQRSAPGSGLRVAEHHADLLAN